MPLSSIHSSVHAVLDAVRAEHPGVPFLALGQTALWDEPVKAAWRRLLDARMPEAEMVAGVHDTDYFAKTTAHLGDDQPYVMLPHDDGQTRDLWSAAGELSCLFGSESVPTRHMFLQHGVPFDWLAKSEPGGKDALYADATTAWGWRGIVYTQSHNVVAHDVPMTQIGPALLEQLDWGFAESLACLADAEQRAAAGGVCRRIRGWVTEFLATCSADCRLSDLYQTLLPKFYELLLNAPADHLSVTSSTKLFCFSRETCALPRFQVVDAFLNPQTADAACRAYDAAVGGSGSGIYTLDAFGAGAIPFDLVIPGVGRGTIHRARTGIVVQTAPQETVIPGPAIHSVGELAEAVEAAFGPECVLVGKAVTLIDMLAAEFLIVFHETASGYTPLTQKLNAGLRAQGIALPLHPIVRLAYPTWDALTSAPEAVFQLPGHLARAFGAETITAAEFAARWREVVAEQRGQMREAHAPRRLRDLLSYLEAHAADGQCWCERADEYEAALKTLRGIAEQSAVLGKQIQGHREEVRGWQRERQDLERHKGEEWRANNLPLRERQTAVRATAFDARIAEARDFIRAARQSIRELRRQRRVLERGPEAQAARARIAEVAREAQAARLTLVRDAFLTVEGLEHTHLRPTAWWLPLVSPDGAWLDAIAAGTQARFEEI